MQDITAVYLLLLAIAVVAVMIRDHMRGQVELLSVRNFALVGFIVFQLTSGSIALFRDFSRYYGLEDSARTGVEYALSCTVYLGILFAVYRWGWGVKQIARKVPAPQTVPPEAFMWVVAVAMVVLAGALRLGVQVPLIAILATYLGDASAAVACGLAGWIWAKRFFNPVAMVYALMIFVSSSAIVAYGSFGRRGLVTVACAFLWAMYYSRWRYNKPGPMIMKMAAVAAGPAILIALYTSVRSSFERDRTPMQHVQAMVTQGDLVLGFSLLLNGQETAGNSMWLMEKFPESFEYQWFHMPKYYIVFAVPRGWWPGKPDALSGRIPYMANLPDVDRRILTIGPGIMGHAAADGGWIATLLYGVLSGLFLRFFDEIVRRSVHSPFVVLPFGAALGQVVALARGETSMFAFIYTFAVAGTYVSLIVVARLLETLGLARRVPSFQEAIDDAIDETDGSDDGWSDDSQAGHNDRTHG